MHQFESAGELELRDYIVILRRRWAWVLVPILTMPLLAALVSARQPDVYRATARVLLANSAAQDAIEVGNSNSFTVSRELANEINLAQSDSTRSEVAERLGVDEAPGGSITADDGSDVLDFTFFGPTGEEAALRANTWAQVYVDVKQETAETSVIGTVDQLEETLVDLRAERANIRADLEALEDRLAVATEGQRDGLQILVDREQSSISGDLNLIDARIASTISSITTLQLDADLAAQGTARIFQVANAPISPTNAPISRNILLGVVVGAILGAGAALLRDNLDQSIATAEDIERMGLTLLGAIPEARGIKGSDLDLVSVRRPDSPVADGYHKIRTALQFVAADSQIHSIVVTSPLQGEGKTTTSVNLAVSFASVGRQVVLVDTDLRRPRLLQIFGTTLTPGVSDAVVGGVPLNEFAVHLSEMPEYLAALPAGTQPPNPSSFLSSPSFGRVAESLKSASDMTIFDAPPVLPVSDALSVSQHTDGVVMVASAGTTSKDDLQSAIDSVMRAGGRLLGIVLVGAKSTGRYGKYEYYGDSAEKTSPFDRPHRNGNGGRQATGTLSNGSTEASAAAAESVLSRPTVPAPPVVQVPKQ